MEFQDADFPDQWQYLHEDTKAKAIEIANALVDEEGMGHAEALKVAMDRARQWSHKTPGRIESASD